MDGANSFVKVDEPGEAEWRTIGQGINSYNTQKTGVEDFSHVCFVLREPDETIVAGVIGQTYWGWLHVDLLWVKEELRGRGYGRELLAMAEQEARERGVGHAYLDTFSFQALDFYRRHGYEIFGELPDFPLGHQRYFLAKQL